MEKIIQITQSPSDSSMQAIGNLVINLHVPYSDKEVTVQINPNFQEYIENQKIEGIEINQLSITTSTIDTRTLLFDFNDNNEHFFNYDDETYNIKLLDIGKKVINGQSCEYFEFLVQWNNSSDETGGAIDFTIYPEQNEINPLQYILDIGDINNLSSKRISVLIDENFNLIFRIIDLDGKEYKLSQELCDYWKTDCWHHIVFSWSNKQVKLKISIETDEAGNLERVEDLNGIRTFHLWDNLPMIIGANLEQKQNAKMRLSEIKVFNIPKL